VLFRIASILDYGNDHSLLGEESKTRQRTVAGRRWGARTGLLQQLVVPWGGQFMTKHLLIEEHLMTTFQQITLKAQVTVNTKHLHTSEHPRLHLKC
jgi:hypothetical protein